MTFIMYPLVRAASGAAMDKSVLGRGTSYLPLDTDCPRRHPSIGAQMYSLGKRINDGLDAIFFGHRPKFAAPGQVPDTVKIARIASPQSGTVRG
jgi:hypothetical protein